MTTESRIEGYAAYTGNGKTNRRTPGRDYSAAFRRRRLKMTRNPIDEEIMDYAIQLFLDSLPSLEESLIQTKNDETGQENMSGNLHLKVEESISKMR